MIQNTLNMLKHGALYFVIIMLLTNCGSQDSTRSERESNIEIPDYNKLVWSDEFDYSGLPDSSKWDYDTEGNSSAWGNNEAQFYTKGRPENAYVQDGILKIVALKENFEDKGIKEVWLAS